ncbi:hypothetical protein [Paenibacillus lemnae]|uniref:Uncharacterized protein n=1 Tax=Paenibacillus lemnae TaxID=1330551 RepID=A0A848MC05_PAELE|nr:hypothetical protein [Paenibacillus lemnae]
MVRPGSGRIENQVYSNRVLRSEFDRNWVTTVLRGNFVKYTATADHARIDVLLADGSSKILIFNKGGYVLVGGGGISHYSKPHKAITV